MPAGSAVNVNVTLASSASGNLAVQLSNVKSALTDGSFDPATSVDGVISVKAARIEGLRAGATAESHDFH